VIMRASFLRRAVAMFASLLVSCVLAFSAGADPSEAEIARLIQQLGSDSFAEREAASKRLGAIGEPAFLPLLRTARSSNDPEVRSRSRDLIEKIAGQLFGEVRRFDGHQQQVSCVAVSADGRRVLSGGLDLSLRIWDGATGRELHCMPNQPGGVWAVAVSRNGKLGLSSAGMQQQGAEWIKGTDFAIRIWNLETGKELRKLEGHTSEVRSIVLSPDDRRALSCGWGMIVRLWRLESGEELRPLHGH